MRKLKFITIFILLLFSFFITPFTFTAVSSGEAMLALYPEKSTFLNPDLLALDVVLEVQQQNINTIYLDLNFPTTNVSLSEALYSDSFCTIIAYESVDVKAGNYRLICGSPTPITEQTATVVRLTFKKVKAGWANFKFGDSSLILAHDGLGTNLLVNQEVHSIYIIK